jgi:hypothetical protein
MWHENLVETFYGETCAVSFFSFLINFDLLSPEFFLLAERDNNSFFSISMTGT